MKNKLVEFLNYFKNSNWNYTVLSDNPNITLDYVLSNLDKNWSWYHLSSNKNIVSSPDIIIKHSNLPWNIAGLSKNPNIDFDYIFSRPELKWHDNNLCCNPNINIEIVEKIILEKKYKINWLDLSKNSGIYWRDINRTQYTKNYNWWNSSVSINPNITEKIVENNNKYIWSWLELSYNKSLSWDFIIKNLDNKLTWYGISENPNITLDIVKANLNKPWSLHEISKHINIYWNNIISNPFLAWSYRGVSSNPNVTMEIVENNINIFEWNKYGLSENPNITIDFVKNHEYIDFDFHFLSKNIFNYDDNMYESNKKFRKYEQELIEKTWHPNRIFEWCLDIDEMNEHK